MYSPNGGRDLITAFAPGEREFISCWSNPHPLPGGGGGGGGYLGQYIDRCIKKLQRLSWQLQ